MPFQNAIGFFQSLGKQPGGTIYDIDGNEYHWVTIGTQQWLVENLKTTKYADGTPIPNIGNYNDWYLPSNDEWGEVMNNLYPLGIGGLIPNETYWTSTEWDSDQAYASDTIKTIPHNKTDSCRVRAVRSFVSTELYAYGGRGLAGGWVFYKSGNNYMEMSPIDLSNGCIWSNITDIEVGITAQGVIIGTGQANTTAIINQVGHTDSAAKLCNDLTSDMLWAADTTGAYCYYDNDIANKADYGALYNWYAVDNAHLLAPTGWRVSSDADFQTLVTFLGGITVAGGKLKEMGVTHWATPNVGADNSSGLTVLPGGMRDTGGPFYFVDSLGALWSSDSIDATHSYYLQLVNYNGSVALSASDIKSIGHYVRCMRDAP